METGDGRGALLVDLLRWLVEGEGRDVAAAAGAGPLSALPVSSATTAPLGAKSTSPPSAAPPVLSWFFLNSAKRERAAFLISESWWEGCVSI